MLRWTATVYGNVVPASIVIVQKHSTYIHSIEGLQAVCGALQGAQICEGNVKPDFITLVEDRGGVTDTKQRRWSVSLSRQSL